MCMIYIECNVSLTPLQDIEAAGTTLVMPRRYILIAMDFILPTKSICQIPKNVSVIASMCNGYYSVFSQFQSSKERQKESRK